MSGSSGGTGTPAWFLGVGFRVDGTTLESAELVVEVVAVPGGKTALRVDSQVTWLPAKNRADTVPPGGARAHRHRAAGRRGHLGPGHYEGHEGHRGLPPGDRPSTGRCGGTYHCPADFAGDTVRLLFRTSTGTKVAAVVEADGSGCGSVAISVGGRQGTPLRDGSSITKLAARLLHLHLARTPDAVG